MDVTVRSAVVPAVLKRPEHCLSTCDDSECLIPHIGIPPDLHNQCIETMLTGNAILKRYHQKMFSGRSYKSLRLRLFYPLERSDRLSPRDFGMTAEEAYAIQDVAHIEPIMLQGHIKCIRKYANRFAPVCRGMIGKEDLMTVGVISLSDAIWSYSNSDVKFLTFASHAIFRGMVKEVSKKDDLVKRSSENQLLLARYYKALIVKPQDNKFEAVIERVTVKDKSGELRAPTAKEVDKLKKMMTRFIRGGDLEKNPSDGDNAYYGMESIADPVAGIDYDAISLQDLIDQAQLTPPELDILLRAQQGDHGYKARWARHWGFSRTYAKDTLLRAYGKVEAVKKKASLKSKYS